MSETKVDLYAPIKELYETRILALLNRMATKLRSAGFIVSDPGDMCGDQYQWSFGVHVESHDVEKYTDGDIDVTFDICESEECDGSENGVTFRIGFVEVGGAVVGEMSPYNFSDRVWVDVHDAAAVEERFCLVEQNCCRGIVKLIRNHTARRAHGGRDVG